MITALTIGENGRLGNQMFQYAALIGLARHKGYDSYSPGGRLFEVFNMHEINAPIAFPNRRLQERQFSFDNYMFENLPDDIDVMGYFQTKKYWAHCESEIRRLFTLQKSTSSEVTKACEDACFLHVRRTDYLNVSDYHANLDISYYKSGIAFIEPKRVILLSDDIEWCKREFSAHAFSSHIDLIYADSLSDDDIGDMSIMMSCKDAIIANSSFSWWGAYLGPQQRSGKIVSPSVWFGPAGPKDTQDIYNDEWEIV